MKQPQNKRRRGSMYVVVLGSTMVITVIGLSALMLARVERTSAEGTADLSAARFYAQSAIEMGQHNIREDSNWRQTYSNGVWDADNLIGTGKYTLEGIDPADGDLNNSPTEPVLLLGTGFEGRSRYKLQVTMVSKSKALTCLEVAMHAGTDLNFNSATVQSNLVTISANNNVTATSASVYPTVEVVNTISGAMYRSAMKTGITPRTMPDATAFDYYRLNGTPIVHALLPKSQGKTTIEKALISPASNPYGDRVTNPKGVYVIDCLGGDLRIRSVRIVGTLVILNPGVLSVSGCLNWEPAIANYPSLLVRGNAELAITNIALMEDPAVYDTNYNPAGTPYQGVQDTDKLDSYPSIITGLVYASGDLTTRTYVRIDGVLVAGNTLTAQDNLSLTYRSTFYDNPPPGFGAAPEMVVSPGTWKQLVD